LLSHRLNVLQFGEEQAANLGVSVHKTRIGIVFFSTLTTAAAISFSGVIGFVGLIIPHVIRILAGGDYRKLIPLSALGGAFFLLLADVIARVLSLAGITVGIITAIACPFFLCC
jgi:iron complex transport system permease protein